MDKTFEPSQETGSAADARYSVPALARGLDALRLVARGGKRQSLTDIANALSVSRSSIYRICYTLVEHGFFDYDEATKTYGIGPAIPQASHAWLSARDLVRTVLPHLEKLRDATGWSAHLAVLEGRDVVILARIATRRTIASTIEVGARLPAYATALGRVLLADLGAGVVQGLYRNVEMKPYSGETPQTVASLVAQLKIDAANGFVIQEASFEPGIAAVAVPVFDVSGSVVAAINVSAAAMLMRDGELHGRLKSETIRAAHAISAALGAPADLLKTLNGGLRHDDQ